MTIDARAFLAAIALAGCATNSGVLPATDGNFTVMHQGGGFLIQTAELKTRAMTEATAYCDTRRKALKVLHVKEIQAGPGRFPETEILFTCQ